jgi:hypothetical protein
MRYASARGLREERDGLWALAAAPTIWAAHFLLCYATAAVWCAKIARDDGSLFEVRLAIAAYTALALTAIGLIGWRGFVKHRRRGGERPHDADSPEDRHRFLGFATSLLSGLSAIATIFSALPAAFIGSCS